MRSHQGRPEDVPAASSNASSRACVSGSTVLRSAPSAALDRSSSEAVFSTGLSRSSWSSMNDSTCMKRYNVSDCAHIIYQTRKRAKEVVLHTSLYIKLNLNATSNSLKTDWVSWKYWAILVSVGMCRLWLDLWKINTFCSSEHSDATAWQYHTSGSAETTQEPHNDTAMTSGYKVQSYTHWHKAIFSSNKTQTSVTFPDFQLNEQQHMHLNLINWHNQHLLRNDLEWKFKFKVNNKKY